MGMPMGNEKADLYLNSIDYKKYVSQSECRKCGVDSCKSLVAQMRSGSFRSLKPETGLCRLIKAALSAEQSLPHVLKHQLPRPVDPGLTELNFPEDGAPILVTGNNQYTQEVLLSVLSGTRSAFYLLCTDTNGDTLDMAVILGSFTVERVVLALEETQVQKKNPTGRLVIPGKAAALEKSLAEVSAQQVDTGPVCVAELPLYFGNYWQDAKL
jgi:CO dehydrogenase/acetyl-CoA synthase gamma subunit (corrinoid Fe-S protein)